jgi:pantoate--beta-alanine ligase
MLQLDSVKALQHFLSKHPGKTVGFVPTMGALHEGHLSLIQAAKKENDLCICSIFVNPKQFNKPEDLKRYPRDIEKDSALLTTVQCDLLFTPDYKEVYPEEPTMQYHFGSIEEVMEGKFRPDHFNGVALVVNRFFQLIQPNVAYFGEKDFQQLAIVKALVKQTNSAIAIRSCPTVRETNGLAKSSRNQLLNSENKTTASSIYHWLLEAKALRKKHEVGDVKQFLEAKFNAHPAFDLEYVEIVDAHSLQPITNWDAKTEVICCVAVYLNGVRLIDNLLF